MSLIVQQIQSRFKYFQIWSLLNLIAIFSLLSNSLPLNFNFVQFSSSNKIYEALILLIILVLLAFVILILVNFSKLVFEIFNYLKHSKGMLVNPILPALSIFIPYFSGVILAFYLKKSSKVLVLEPTSYNRNLFFSSVVLVLSIALSLFYRFSSVTFRARFWPDSIVITNPFWGSYFYFNLISLILAFAVIYFTWKTMKEIKDAVVAESII